MTTKVADIAEKDQAYLSGYSAWGNNMDREKYLEECRNNTKYMRGTWYVYVMNDIVVSSLITYALDNWNDGKTIGIGSVATFDAHRNNGYAKALMIDVMDQFLGDVDSIFLYADIKPGYYEALGFHVMSNECQRYPSSLLMVKTKLVSHGADLRNIPKYF